MQHRRRRGDNVSPWPCAARRMRFAFACVRALGSWPDGSTSKPTATAADVSRTAFCSRSFEIVCMTEAEVETSASSSAKAASITMVKATRASRARVLKVPDAVAAEAASSFTSNAAWCISITRARTLGRSASPG